MMILEGAVIRRTTIIAMSEGQEMNPQQGGREVVDGHPPVVVFARSRSGSSPATAGIGHPRRLADVQVVLRLPRPGRRGEDNAGGTATMAIVADPATSASLAERGHHRHVGFVAREQGNDVPKSILPKACQGKSRKHNSAYSGIRTYVASWHGSNPDNDVRCHVNNGKQNFQDPAQTGNNWKQMQLSWTRFRQHRCMKEIEVQTAKLSPRIDDARSGAQSKKASSKYCQSQLYRHIIPIHCTGTITI